jgi:glycosyltransferase involved in cell wall biosynthesis
LTVCRDFVAIVPKQIRDKEFLVKIAIMMRAMDQDSGHQAIIMGLVGNMLKLDRNNTYLLLYRTTRFFGHFADFPNAQERLVSAPHKLLWDQVAVPYYAWKDHADVIYNPKFSVPLITHCPVVMGLHEPAWWAWPEHYEWLDRVYMKTMLPIYIRKSKHLFPISRFVVDECKKYIDFPFDNVTIAYPAPKPHFRKIEDKHVLSTIKEKYNLPEQFIFSATRVDHPGLDKSDSFFPGKNSQTTVRAYINIRHEIPHQLVVAGRRVKEFLLWYGFSESELDGIRFLDFIPHEEMPAILNLASLFVLPSYYESYAMALVEAMSCGCPVVAATTGACPEITAGIAELADPDDPADFSRKIKLILLDEKRRLEIGQAVLERSHFFNYERTAKVIIKEIEKLING